MSVHVVGYRKANPQAMFNTEATGNLVSLYDKCLDEQVGLGMLFLHPLCRKKPFGLHYHFPIHFWNI